MKVSKRNLDAIWVFGIAETMLSAARISAWGLLSSRCKRLHLIQIHHLWQLAIIVTSTMWWLIPPGTKPNASDIHLYRVRFWSMISFWSHNSALQIWQQLYSTLFVILDCIYVARLLQDFFWCYSHCDSKLITIVLGKPKRRFSSGHIIIKPIFCLLIQKVSANEGLYTRRDLPMEKTYTYYTANAGWNQFGHVYVRYF